MLLTVRFINHNEQVEQEHWPVELRWHRYLRPSAPAKDVMGYSFAGVHQQRQQH